jgi:hypothetical protein
MRFSLQDVEKGRQLCSRIARNLNVPKNVRLGPSLAAAALNGLFEHLLKNERGGFFTNASPSARQ